VVESVVTNTKRQETSVLVITRRDHESEDNVGWWFSLLKKLNGGVLFNDVRHLSGGFDKASLDSFRAAFPRAGQCIPGFDGHPVRRGPHGFELNTLVKGPVGRAKLPKLVNGSRLLIGRALICRKTSLRSSRTWTCPKPRAGAVVPPFLAPASESRLLLASASYLRLGPPSTSPGS
jgi:hypothetical protein